MTGSLDGQVALVTGGSSGIGRATALTFAREGARIGVADLDEEGGHETVRMIENDGGEALFVRTDVATAADAEAMVSRTVGAYGRLDCAFNNAGVEGGVGTLMHEYPEDLWDTTIGINLKGVWLGMKYEIIQMLEQGGGAIVNTSSGAGLRGGAPAGYVASKHGVVGLTRTAALEYALKGIRVNAVCPGSIMTPMAEQVIARVPQAEERVLAGTPAGRHGTAEEVAEAVVWLCSEAASFVTGHAMSVDGGSMAR